MHSRMNGIHEIADGQTTNFWGYGIDGEGMSLPAPLLEFNLGDTVHIQMRNPSPEAHTIHLHGLDVDQVNDGVPQTSFYVFHGDTATYSFVADQAGTFLYHCHVTTTLHLTMGMYGMIKVQHPDQLLYAGGPSFEQEYHFLFSDLEVAVNDEPLQAFPFHEIRPDHFMVNGKAAVQIDADSSMHIIGTSGQAIALRLGSMAYAKTKVIFPEGANATVYMSDGRPLPSAFNAEELPIYPGERFTVIIRPDQALNEEIEVQYFNMLNDELEASNFIPLRISANVTAPDFLVPNPSAGQFSVRVDAESEVFDWYSIAGKMVASFQLGQGVHQIQLPNLAPGMYLVRTDSGKLQKVVLE